MDEKEFVTVAQFWDELMKFHAGKPPVSKAWVQRAMRKSPSVRGKEVNGKWTKEAPRGELLLQLNDTTPKRGWQRGKPRDTPKV